MREFKLILRTAFAKLSSLTSAKPKQDEKLLTGDACALKIAEPPKEQENLTNISTAKCVDVCQSQKTIHNKISQETNSCSSSAKLLERIKQVKLTTPPGLAGEICEDLARMERRKLEALRPACALGLLSLLGYRSKTLAGEKMSFYALCVAPSAAGKEAHLRYFRAACEVCDMSQAYRAEPRSDKQVMQDLVESTPLVYLLDEAHKFFGAALDAKSTNTYMSAVGDLLLELKTTNLFKVPRSVRASYENDVKKVIAKLEAKDTLTPNELEQLDNQKKLLSFFENGIPNPQLWVIGYTTPMKSAFFVNEDTISSGFIGRVYLFPGEENRTPMDFESTKTSTRASTVSKELIPRFKAIMESNVDITLSEKGENLFREIFKFFESDHRVNHEHLGSLYARGIEHVLNIASILALETRVINEEMLLYGTKLYLHSINAAHSELSNKISDSYQQLLKSADKVVKRITADGPLSLGVLANHFEKCNVQIRNMRKKGNDSVHYEQLKKLISAGKLIEKDGKFIHKDNL